MDSSILAESRTFLYFFLMGVGLTLVYDVLRLFRFLIPHNLIWISIEDLIFWIVTAIVVFLMFIRMNNGSIRFFSIGATILGIVAKNRLTVNIKSCRIFHKELSKSETEKSDSYASSSVPKEKTK